MRYDTDEKQLSITFKGLAQLHQYKKLNRKGTAIQIYCPLFDELYSFSHVNVLMYGTWNTFRENDMVLVDANLLGKYPQIRKSELILLCIRYPDT